MKRYATSSFLLLSFLLIQDSRASNSGLSDGKLFCFDHFISFRQDVIIYLKMVQ